MKLICLYILFYSTSIFAGSKVCIDHLKNEVQISSHYYFYGDEAKPSVVQPCVNEINRGFNINAHVQLNRTGPWRRVVVKVTSSILTNDYAEQFIFYNQDPTANFIRIGNPPKGSRIVVSEHGLSRNFGYFDIQNDLGRSTTCTHEFGHGLGLEHVPGVCDWRGLGIPPIMAPRGCLVDSQYQYDPMAEAGGVRGTMDPSYRRVQKYEIAQLNIGDLKFKTVSKDLECAVQGKVTQRFYLEDGSSYTPTEYDVIRKSLEPHVLTSKTIFPFE